jgi:hypothetical protein
MSSGGAGAAAGGDLDKAYDTQYSRTSKFLNTLEVEIGAAPILSCEAVDALVAANVATGSRERYAALVLLQAVVDKRWTENAKSPLTKPENTRTYEQLTLGFKGLKERYARGARAY